MKLTIESEIWREGDMYVARANPLNVLSCGQSRAQAEQALLEAVELFLETAQGAGTLEDILWESGYVYTGNEWTLLRRPERHFSSLEIPLA
jgi:hypothetical protein